MKVIKLFLTILLTYLISYGRSVKLGMETFRKKNLHNIQANYVNKDESNQDSNSQTFFRGWVKYLHFTEKEKTKPKAFYKNIEFDMQKKRLLYNSNHLDKDIDCPEKALQSELHFYAVLYKDNLNIISSDKNSFANVIDTLDLNYIRPIPDDKLCDGGIKDLPKYDEGYCFEIIVLIPLTQFTPTQEQLEPKESIRQTWIFCLDLENEKKQLMNAIINLKRKIQHSLGLVVQYVHLNVSEDRMGIQVEEKKVAEDGRWVMIQDWTECTLKCGGGMKYQQYVCIPPKNGGRQCEGEAVRTMQCNIQPCPDANNMNLDIMSMMGKMVTNISSVSSINISGNTTPTLTTNTLIPIIKTLKVSERPQRYDKCFIKESDVFMIKEDELTRNMVNKPRIPVRLIMNDKTLSAYLTDNLNSMLVTFLLNESTFVRSKQYVECFEIMSPSKTSIFCPLDQKPEFLEEWDYDFNLFKNQCKRERVKSGTYLTDEKKIESEFKSEMKSLKERLILEISQRNQKKTEEDEVKLISNQVQKTQIYSLRALQREIELEKLLEREELEREERENEELEKEIQIEKKKEDCLNNAIKQKEIESQFSLVREQAKSEISEIQEKTRREISIKRQEITKKILELKRKQLRKKLALKNEILLIKSKVADKMNKYSRKGNAAICKDKSQQEVYCDTYLKDDIFKYPECKKEESFCEICCENEFGNWHQLERDECYKKCENK